MVGKGQPPKAPEDKRKYPTIGFSPKEKEIVEEARKIEAPEKGFGTYVRETTLNHAQEVIDNNKK